MATQEALKYTIVSGKIASLFLRNLCMFGKFFSTCTMINCEQ